MKYPAYPHYKDSGVAWLGEVPEHWEVRRLKYLASINDSALPESTNADFEFSYIDIGSVNLIDGITATESMTFENAPSRARRVVQAGDIIVSTVRTYLRAIASIPQSGETLIVSTGFAVIRPRRIESKFLNYALKESSFVENVVSRSVGVSYPAVNASEIGDIQILAPSEAEQTTIADFLDRETGRIDTLVAKKRKLVELLKEKRSALISRTVTRGLPADAAREFGLTTGNSAVHEASGAYGRCRGEKFFAPTEGNDNTGGLKDSGVEWLGEIPMDWKTAPLRRLIKFVKTGGTPTGAEEQHFETKGFNWYTPGDFSESVYLGPSARALSEEGKTEVRFFPPMTVMLVGIGATIGKVGLAEMGASCNQQINGIVCDINLDPVFATYYLKTMRDFIVNCGKYTTMPIINQDETKNLIFTVPPITEQTAIATYLDRETAKIDRLVAKVETAIARLQEYRSALITAAVTGKIDVREA